MKANNLGENGIFWKRLLSLSTNKRCSRIVPHCILHGRQRIKNGEFCICHYSASVTQRKFPVPFLGKLPKDDGIWLITIIHI